MKLINDADHARVLAPGSTPAGRRFLTLHRRAELLVAALVVGTVTILAVEADPAAAQSAALVVAPALRALCAERPSRSSGPFLQRKIRCRTVSSRLQDGD